MDVADVDDFVTDFEWRGHEVLDKVLDLVRALALVRDVLDDHNQCHHDVGVGSPVVADVIQDTLAQVDCLILV